MRQDTAQGRERDPAPSDKGGWDSRRYDRDRSGRYRAPDSGWGRHGPQGHRSSSSRPLDERVAPRERSWSRDHRWHRTYPDDDRRSGHRSARGRYDYDRKRRRASPSPPPRQPVLPRADRDRREEMEPRVLPRKQQGLSVRGAADRLRQENRGWRPVDDARATPAHERAAARSSMPPGPPPPRPPPRVRATPEVRPATEPEPPSAQAHDVAPRVLMDEAYEIVAQVGEGTYGQVYKASAERSGALVALKKIRMESAREGFPVTSMREMKLLQSLRHENVIRMHETMTSRTGSVYMVFEYMEHDLNGILVHPDVQFTDAHRKSLVAQLLRGLAYLHARSVLHRDLKGSNLLLNNEGVLKLADFGLARTYTKRQAGDYTNRVVTLWYRPPELLLGASQYGPEVDVWGAGCLFVELFTRQALFPGRDEIHQLHQITRVLGPLTPHVWPGVMALPWYDLMRLEEEQSETPCLHKDGAPDTPDVFAAQLPPSAVALAHGLLTYDPQQRWSATQALSNPYFTEAPAEERPARILATLGGEWHEMQSKRALRRARAGAT